jgi:hypothetical protein
VRINEEIKSVVGVAFKINIMALNAIFLPNAPVRQRAALACCPTNCASSRKTCATACWSLTSLAWLRQRSVADVAGYPSYPPAAPGRRDVERSADGCRAGRRELKNARHAASLASQRKQLKRALEDAFQMVELGGVLAKSAKIEAAYGQSSLYRWHRYPASSTPLSKKSAPRWNRCAGRPFYRKLNLRERMRENDQNNLSGRQSQMGRHRSRS